MRLRLADRMSGIAPFRVMELLGRARALEAEGRSIVHMEIGEPDFPTPEPVMRAAAAALAAGHTRYTPALGLPELRRAIAAFYRDRHGVAVAPERIVVTPGASGALLLALGVLVNRDDEVLLADPGYPCNRHFVRFVEGRPVPVVVGAQERYQLTAAAVAAQWGPRTVAAMVATPSNPTGTILSAAELTALDQTVAAAGGRLIVDEIYQGLVYDRPSETALAVSDRLFVINSFSKYFCMTGWRLGWLVVPEGYVEAVERLAQNLFIAPPTPSQYAALAAFEPENVAILEARRDEMKTRRDFLLPAVQRLGFTVAVESEGAFYLYAGCGGLTDDSRRLCLDLLEHAGVAVTPGLDFGDHLPERHVRFAYTTSLEQLEDGVRRIERFLA